MMFTGDSASHLMGMKSKFQLQLFKNAFELHDCATEEIVFERSILLKNIKLRFGETFLLIKKSNYLITPASFDDKNNSIT